MVKKFYFILLIIIFGSLLLPKKVSAADEFGTDYSISYEVEANGLTTVLNDITLINKQNDVIATNYTLSIKQLNLMDIDVYDSKGKLKFKTETKDDNTIIEVEFDKEVIGEGRKNNFKIKFKTKDISSKVGNIWNISIPKIQTIDDTGTYNVSVSIPLEMGPEIYIVPNPADKTTTAKTTIYKFTRTDLKNRGISASFGKYQSLNFQLKYFIFNDSSFAATKEIALPSDIQLRQQVSFKQIDPQPENIFIDKDGNYIATYKLAAKQKLTITLTGSANIMSKQINPQFGGEIKDMPKNLVSKYTGKQPFWEVNSPIVKDLAATLLHEDKTVSENALELYNYITKNLAYDFDLVKNDYIDRKGALFTLQNLSTGKWACMEFTDTFITVARAMGIPARELDGFAFVNDKSTTPLSINLKGGDLLHSWAEYYDPNFGWVPVDPTWGATSSIDYFSKLDTSHFVFAIKGSNSELPLPAGSYRDDSASEKYISVEFSQQPNDADFDEKLSLIQVIDINPLDRLKNLTKYLVKNEGFTAVYDINGKGTTLLPYESVPVYLKGSSRSITYKNFTGVEITKELPSLKTLSSFENNLVLYLTAGLISITSGLIGYVYLRKREKNRK